MSRFASAIATVIIFFAGLSGSAGAGVGSSALEPASGGGIEEVDRALARLASHRRLLIVGAHPDDEDNALLAHVSQGLGGEVAYLSLTRGEGGQNLIGSELGPELGVVRTGELESARALEGGRQYFTRAFDFGYTRSLEETFERWPREDLQLDAVRVARRFKPQVLVAVFPASTRAGHGQHQASAVIADDVFRLAGDPSAFAELEREGLEVWRPAALYRRAWWGEEATVRFVLDRLDPITGRSHGQLAAASRSLHRSQDMGRVQRIGEVSGGLVWLAGGSGASAIGVFDGIDTRLAAIAASIEDGTVRGAVEELLERVESESRSIRSRLTPLGLESSVDPIARIVELLDRAYELVGRSESGAVLELLAEKRAAAESALLAAAGIVFDATLDREVVVVGGEAHAELELWSADSGRLTVTEVGLASGEGWTVGSVSEIRDEEDTTGVMRWGAKIEVPRNASPTAPYYLGGDPIGDMYDWEEVAFSTRGEPFSSPPLTALLVLEVAGVPVRLEREVVYRYGDQAVGEVRRPVRAVPALEVELDSTLELWRRGVTKEAEIEVVVRSNLDMPTSGRLVVEAPPGWSAGGAGDFTIDTARGSTALMVRLAPSDVLRAGRQEVRFAVESASGRFARSYPVLEYDHIRPRVVPRAADLEMSVFDLELPELDRVGYVAGASDRVPEVLRALGVPLAELSDDELRVGDLNRYDVIVVGSRAYETNSELRRSNPRLLDYVNRGGTLIVQYQQYQFVRGEYAPRPFVIERPHGRVTDEAAPVRILDPSHPILARPNAIGDADWQGWVQERGLYFPSSWDDAYRPVLAMQDPGGDEELGSLLVARVGAGTYVYSGLSFFRQLPVGVPGAIRLFANLLAAGRAADPTEEVDK